MDLDHFNNFKILIINFEILEAKLKNKTNFTWSVTFNLIFMLFSYFYFLRRKTSNFTKQEGPNQPVQNDRWMVELLPSKLHNLLNL